MTRSYKWGWQISDMGYKGISPNCLTHTEIDKMGYVNQYLAPSVEQARCGWAGIAYCVCDINGNNRAEFVLMFWSKYDTPHNARWINVTGDSKGAIAETVWSLVFC